MREPSLVDNPALNVTGGKVKIATKTGMQEVPAGIINDLPGLAITGGPDNFTITHISSGFALVGHLDKEQVPDVINALRPLSYDWTLDEPALTKFMNKQRAARLNKAVRKAMSRHQAGVLARDTDAH